MTYVRSEVPRRALTGSRVRSELRRETIELRRLTCTDVVNHVDVSRDDGDRSRVAVRSCRCLSGVGRARDAGRTVRRTRIAECRRLNRMPPPRRYGRFRFSRLRRGRE